MPTGLGPRSGTCFKLEYKWLRVCGCRADADVDVDGAGVICCSCCALLITPQNVQKCIRLASLDFLGNF